MSPALWTLISVFVGAAVLRVPIAFSMLAAGVAYLAVNGSDVAVDDLSQLAIRELRNPSL